MIHEAYPKGIRKLPHIPREKKRFQALSEELQASNSVAFMLLKRKEGDKEHEEWVSGVPWRSSEAALLRSVLEEEWPHPHRSTASPSLSLGRSQFLDSPGPGSLSIDNRTNIFGEQQLCNCSGRCLVPFQETFACSCSSESSLLFLDTTLFQ